MNQEQILIELFISLPIEEKNKIIFQYGSDNPDNFQTVLSIFTRSSKTEEEIQETFISKKQPLTMNDLETDDEPEDYNNGPIFPPGTVTVRRFSDLDLQRLNQLSSSDRRREISNLNLNDRDRKALVNKLWRLANPDRVRSNSRRSYQKRHCLSNGNDF
uniref:Uncharacterized protein n=1 Tax=viral metagenome TaxID=1070528 RepID=A0A6C0DDQ2_9ZZZZ